MAKERDLLKILFQTFVKSLRPRKFTGNLVGKDYMGTEYFEIEADPKLGKRKPTRYFEPKDKDENNQELPAEWEAWLRFRRKLPPTEEEIRKNLEIAQLKKTNARQLEANRKKPGPELPLIKSGARSFPVYEEYEDIPGKSTKST